MMKKRKQRENQKQRTLHVLFTGFVYKKVITGGDQLFFDIGPRLPRDIDITIITPHFAAKYWDGLKTDNMTIKELPPNLFEFKGNPVAIMVSYMIRAYQTYRILSKDDVHTVYSCSDISYADIWPAYLLKRKQKNVVWLSRIYHVLLSPKKRQGNPFTNLIAFKLQRLSFWMMKKRSNTIFSLNNMLDKELQGIGFSRPQLQILEAGIDFDAISSHKASAKYSFDFVVLGRLAPVKGIYDMLEAWKIVHKKHPKLRLAWIGGGDESIKQKLSQISTNSNFRDTFSYLGFIDKDEVYDILQSAKVFVCPDHENGWGLAVCEAMASGLPVVSYDLDIFGGVYKKGFVSAPLFDKKALAGSMIELIENKELRLKIAKDAKDQAKEFNHDKVVHKLNTYIN